MPNSTAYRRHMSSPMYESSSGAEIACMVNTSQIAFVGTARHPWSRWRARERSSIVRAVAKLDGRFPTPRDTPLTTPAARKGLRLARFGLVLTLALIGTVLLSAGVFTSALWLLGFPALTPSASGISLARLLDPLKLSLAVVAGVGGVIALVVAYRRQKVIEAAEHRQQAAEQRADGAHQREATKLFNERFATAAPMLGHDAPAVRLAGVQALAGLADDAPTRELRQMVIDVLCSYLRLPYTSNPGEDSDADERLSFARLREVRHTIIRIITAHLRDSASRSWQGTISTSPAWSSTAGTSSERRSPAARSNSPARCSPPVRSTLAARHFPGGTSTSAARRSPAAGSASAGSATGLVLPYCRSRCRPGCCCPSRNRTQCRPS